jgi:two-component system nitrogen regulation response regulator NtrX
MMEQVLILGGEGGPITAEELPGSGDSDDAGLGGIMGMVASLPLREARDMFERSYLSRRLREVRGSVSELAPLVGMERTHLYRKLRALGVDSKSAMASGEGKK